MDDKKLEKTAKKIRKALDKNTSLPYAKIKLTDGKTTIFSSKVGGKPYLPKDAQIPQDSHGKPMRLLAQINCKDIKKLPDYPHKGILQFFISADDDLCGMSFDDQTEQKDFRVIYHKKIDKSVKEQDIPDFIKDEMFPVYGEYAMKFTFGKQGIQPSDYRFDEAFENAMKEKFPKAEKKAFNDQPEELCEIFYGSDSVNHRIGGYPFFTQYDPRDTTDGKLKKYARLLFQLDSDGDKNGDRVLWGDCGIANFFISFKDLQNRNFSDVLYNWDCC